MKVLLIGGSGFIGSWLSLALKNNSHEVMSIDPVYNHSDYPDELFEKVVSFRTANLLRGVDLVKEDFLLHNLEDKIREFNPDAIVHLAAIPIEKPFEDKISRLQLSQDNELTYKAILLARDLGVERFIYMSSLFAYGDHEYSVSEYHELKPKTAYGIMKASGEFMVRNFISHANIIRTTSVYGFGDGNNRFNQIVINRILQGKEFWINKDAWLDFIYVKDLVTGMVKLLESNILGEAFHISGGRALTMEDFINELSKKYMLKNYEVRSVNDRPKRGTLDNTKARLLLGWEPSYSLETGVEDYLNFVKKYKFA